jgi:hypothetical protein
MMFLLGVSNGCYTYVPVASPAAPGSQLRFELNDRGRVDLGQAIGSSAETVEGVLTADKDSVYAVKVVAVTYRNGQANRWNGEPLVVGKPLVREVTERKFSRSRTFLAVAGATAGVLLLIAGRGLIGGGTPDHDTKEGGGNGSFR